MHVLRQSIVSAIMMKMKTNSSHLVYCAIVSLFVAGCTSEQPTSDSNGQVGPAEDEKPNVLLIYPDQLRRYSAGFWHMPAYRPHVIGAPDPVFTPSIDQLATNGIVLTNALSNFPLCSPHRGMLLSGRYPSNNGLMNNARPGRPDSLRSDIDIITDVFHTARYDVAYFGKAHWLSPKPYFDEQGVFVGSESGSGGHYLDSYDTYVPPGRDRHSIKYYFQTVLDDHFEYLSYSNDPYTVGGNADGVPFQPKEYSTKVEARYIIDYIQNNRDQRSESTPFFIMWSPNPPHAPWDADNVENEIFDTYYSDKQVADIQNLIVRDNADQSAPDYIRHYFSNVTSVDKYIGDVISALEQEGLLENTIVILTSDHGEMLGSHGLSGKNVLYTEALAVPLIIHWPDKLKTNINGMLFNAPDTMPTILGLAGLEKYIPSDVDGTNFAPNILDAPDAREPHSVSLLMTQSGRGITDGQYLLSVVKGKDGTANLQLFDTHIDPYQQNNIANEENAVLIERLLVELGVLLHETNDSWAQEGRFDQLIPYPEN